MIHSREALTRATHASDGDVIQTGSASAGPVFMRFGAARYRSVDTALQHPPWA
jgi:hypothetical protein